MQKSPLMFVDHIVETLPTPQLPFYSASFSGCPLPLLFVSSPKCFDTHIKKCLDLYLLKTVGYLQEVYVFFVHNTQQCDQTGHTMVKGLPLCLIQGHRFVLAFL